MIPTCGELSVRLQAGPSGRGAALLRARALPLRSRPGAPGPRRTRRGGSDRRPRQGDGGPARPRRVSSTGTTASRPLRAPRRRPRPGSRGSIPIEPWRRSRRRGVPALTRPSRSMERLGRRAGPRCDGRGSCSSRCSNGTRTRRTSRDGTPVRETAPDAGESTGPNPPELKSGRSAVRPRPWPPVLTGANCVRRPTRFRP